MSVAKLSVAKMPLAKTAVPEMLVAKTSVAKLLAKRLLEIIRQDVSHQGNQFPQSI